MKKKKILAIVLLFVFALSMTGCDGGKGKAKGKSKNNYKVIYDISNSSNYCKFDTTNGTVSVVLYEYIEGIGKTNISNGGNGERTLGVSVNIGDIDIYFTE